MKLQARPLFLCRKRSKPKPKPNLLRRKGDLTCKGAAFPFLPSGAEPYAHAARYCAAIFTGEMRRRKACCRHHISTGASVVVAFRREGSRREVEERRRRRERGDEGVSDGPRASRV